MSAREESAHDSTCNRPPTRTTLDHPHSLGCDHPASDARGAARIPRQGGLDESLVEDVVLCVQEACKNAVRHSRCDDEIVVRLALELWAVRVTVRDFGVGMGPHAEAAAPAPLAETGRGLHIIRCLMDELEVRVNDGTEVRMVKHLSPVRVWRHHGSLGAVGLAPRISREARR
jgi:serine/threonine-protein kinase RsbW